MLPFSAFISVSDRNSRYPNTHDAEVQETIGAVLSAIEPILTVVMGVIVLTIALSMFLPLFNITKLMK